MRLRIALITASGLVLHCAKPPDPCAFQRVQISAVFLGDAYARGTIALERREDAIVGHTVLDRMEGQAPSAAPALELAGGGLCEDGIVKLELAAGTTADGSVRVLGGEVHVVLSRAGLVDQPFGQWRAEIARDEWDAPRSLGGPWVVAHSTRTATSTLAAR